MAQPRVSQTQTRKSPTKESQSRKTPNANHTQDFVKWRATSGGMRSSSVGTTLFFEKSVSSKRAEGGEELTRAMKTSRQARISAVKSRTAESIALSAAEAPAVLVLAISCWIAEKRRIPWRYISLKDFQGQQSQRKGWGTRNLRRGHLSKSRPHPGSEGEKRSLSAYGWRGIRRRPRQRRNPHQCSVYWDYLQEISWRH